MRGRVSVGAVLAVAVFVVGIDVDVAFLLLECDEEGRGFDRGLVTAVVVVVVPLWLRRAAVAVTGLVDVGLSIVPVLVVFDFCVVAVRRCC